MTVFSRTAAALCFQRGPLSALPNEWPCILKPATGLYWPAGRLPLARPLCFAPPPCRPYAGALPALALPPHRLTALLETPRASAMSFHCQTFWNSSQARRRRASFQLAGGSTALLHMAPTVTQFDNRSSISKSIWPATQPEPAARTPDPNRPPAKLTTIQPRQKNIAIPAPAGTRQRGTVVPVAMPLAPVGRYPSWPPAW